jgi:hypothetical protein
MSLTKSIFASDLAPQAPNMVLASPDGVAGQPDFRSLTANDVTLIVGPTGPAGPAGPVGATGPAGSSGTIQNPVKAITSAISTPDGTEIYATPTFILLANTLNVADCFRITVLGQQSDGGSNSLFNFRLGPNGNLSDPIILTLNQGSFSNGNFSISAVATIRANGSSGVLAIGAKSDLTVNMDAPVAINTTANNFLGMSYLGGTDDGSSDFIHLSIIEQIR